MIGYQCSASAQVSASSNQHLRASLSQNSAASNSNPSRKQNFSTSSSPDEPNTHHLHQNQPQSQVSLKREPVSTSCAAILSSLSSHISLINQSAGKSSPTVATNQQQATSGQTQAQQQSSSNALAPNSAASSPQQHLMQQSASSPGYHSAASSPSSSVSSPVCSSSASSSAGYSSSSGISSAQSPVCSSNPTNASNSASVSPSCSRSPISPNLLDYYPEINQDGLGLSWFHEANNRAKLNSALMSNKMLISGDISLAEMSRYPVPIMAKPPLGVSDITLENWLQEVIHSQPQRGIKLTFTSTRTVEPAFRVLARHAELLKGPMILNADILTRPSAFSNGAQNGRQNNNRNSNAAANAAAAANQQQPVDAWTFLMLCRTRFPKSIISIGWCSQQQQQQQQQQSSQTFINSSWPLMTGVQDNQLLIGGHCNPLTDSSSLSLHSSVDSMFELDILDAPGGFGQLSNTQQLANMNHLQHLNHHQHRIHQHRVHQHLHPYPLIQHQHQHQGARGLINQQQLSQHLHSQHQNHHHILSSAGSLNSSSGNSSGSPSPTSPVSHLMSPPHQIVATNLSIGSKVPTSISASSQQVVDSTERLFLSAADQQRDSPALGAKSSSANAAAAAMAAAVMAATSFHQQQLPLNLNINEAADATRTSSPATGAAATVSQLSQLAQKIQHSYQQQQQQQNLTNTTTNNQLSSTTSNLTNEHSMNRLFQQHHPHKKPALGPPSVTSPSQSSSILVKQEQQSNLLLKTTNNSNNQPQSGGYSREMIDKMASLVKEYNLTQPVTFPVEARLLRNSLSELQRLLYQVGSNSTLTVVAQQDDLISIDDLLTIRKAFATNQVLFDLPDELAASFRQELDLL